MASIKKNGNTWRVQYRDPRGKARTKSGFRTKTAAQAWADKNATTIYEGDWINPTAGRMTVGELGEKWLSMQTHLKPSTLVWQQNVWRSAVAPYWGTSRLQNILPSEVQEWVSKFDASSSWVRHAHSCLAQILDMAVSDGMLRVNPARGVTLPRRAQPRHVYLTAEQLVMLAAECGDRADLIMLLGTSGLRWGEAIALRPMDLDPLRSRISVARNAVKVGGEFVVGSPKTHEARTVAVARQVMEALVVRSEGMAADDLLWRSARGGWLAAPGHKTWFDGAVRRCQDASADFPRLTVHGLRHVAAGLLVESGANVKAVQRQLGHKSAAMTLDTYAELFEDGLDEIATSLDETLADVVEMS